jgi:hypothetical protein
MNGILSSVSFRNFSPNTWFASPQFEMCEYVGNRTGILSLVNMSIAILFAGRNNLLIALTGWSQMAFLTLHRWAARVAALQAVVHSIAYTVAYFEPGSGGAGSYAAEATLPFYISYSILATTQSCLSLVLFNIHCTTDIQLIFVLPLTSSLFDCLNCLEFIDTFRQWWGIIATIALCLATGFAVLPLRIKFYEFFLITHIAFIILALIGCWYHLVPYFGYTYGYQVWLYICFAFWAADRIARVVRVAYYNRLGNSTAIVEALSDCDIMQVTVFPRVGWAFGPGQHSFLYVPRLGKFWESHPFSIAGWKSRGQAPVTVSASPSLAGSTAKEEEKDSAVVSTASLDSDPTARKQQTTISCQNQGQDRPSIKFLIRVHSGMTSTLQRRLLSLPSRSSMEISVYTEGSYAGYRATLQPLFLADTVLCLVGGIGITNALGFVQEYTAANVQRGKSLGKGRGMMKKATRFILAWSAREMALIEHVKRNFLAETDDVEGIEYLFWYTGSSDTTAQKLDPVDESQRRKV